MTSAEMYSAMFYNKFIIFDTESTGFQPNNTYSKLIEIGAVKVENGNIVDRFDKLINPGIPIPKKISELTGITNDMVKDCEDIPHVLKEFHDWCKGDYVFIGHNVQHDIRFLTFFGDQYGINFNKPALDTQVLAKEILKDGWWAKINSRIKESYKLSSLAILFGIQDNNHHRADNDAEVDWEVFKCLKKTAVKKKPDSIYLTWKYPEEENAAPEESRAITIVNASPWDKGERLYITLSTNDGEDHFSYIYYDFKRHSWGVKDCSFPVPFDRVEKFIVLTYGHELRNYQDFRTKKWFKDQVI